MKETESRKPDLIRYTSNLHSSKTVRSDGYFSGIEDYSKVSAKFSHFKSERSSREILVYLYSMWQPQLSVSYRKGATEVPAEEGIVLPPRVKAKPAKREKDSRNGKESRTRLRAAETVVEAVNHMQRKDKMWKMAGLSASRRSSADSSSHSPAQTPKQLKRSMSQYL